MIFAYPYITFSPSCITQCSPLCGFDYIHFHTKLHNITGCSKKAGLLCGIQPSIYVCYFQLDLRHHAADEFAH